MKKAVPLALVLIAGAAVILWFGNRLNSWVLGGLIGGLASLLLSIPISLVLFAYFVRQQDEHAQYRQRVGKRLPSRRSTYSPAEGDMGGYYDPPYALGESEISADGEEYDQSLADDGNQFDEEFGFSNPPSPRGAGRSTRHLPTQYTIQQRQTNLGAHQMRGEEEPRTRRTTVPRRPAYPGLPGSQKNPQRSRVRFNALRTARLEAARQNVEEDEPFFDDYDEPFIDPAAPSRREREPRTGHLPADTFSDQASIDIHRPLQRRAPYTYEDDPIRQDMARYTDAPPVRRSTRYLHDRNNQDGA